MYRNIEQKLKVWKESERRKPLILKGARQVGKSYTVEKFGRENFQNCVIANFEKQKMLADIFSGDLHIPAILQRLEVLLNTRIDPARTLLFFDEIQKCPRAITALRYFWEERPDIAVIAAGSLLDFSIEEAGVPVGRVTYLYMHPFSFHEFLLALGENMLAEKLAVSLPEEEDVVHFKSLSLVKKYFQVGGMPEAIDLYLKTGSLKEVGELQLSLVETYRQDFTKYASKIPYDIMLTVLEKLPQLIGTQIKYSHIDKDARTTLIKQVILLLERAQVLYRVRAARVPSLPLGVTSTEKVFKAILLDIGLLQALCGVDWGKIPEKEDPMNIYNGALAEQFVGQEIMAYTSISHFQPLYYWKREERGSSAEIDYLVEHDGAVAPVEVKSDKAGRLRSLHLFNEKFHPKKSFIVSSHPQARLESFQWIPFYGLGRLLQTRV
ncbi:MAG: ATP-binding protein [Deltaproteobacteria bacterium]|nr:ATP-binding protein [Deltaproteobacteria bacterium]